MQNYQSSVANGLSTDTYKVASAGMYYMSAQTTVLQPSGLVITLSQSGSVSSSVSTPTTSPVQESISIQHTFNCAVGDILTCAVTSSANVDQPPSLIKTTINMRQES